jgi:hypothetical protein
MKATKTVTITYKAVGLKESIEKIDGLTKSVDNFFQLGKKYKIPKGLLFTMLSFQIENKSKK